MKKNLMLTALSMCFLLSNGIVYAKPKIEYKSDTSQDAAKKKEAEMLKKTSEKK